MQEQFAQKMIEILNLFTETQSENMKTVADIIVDRIKEGGRFFVFGTGHSHMVGEEFYARAGGLACVQLIAPMELTLGEHPLKSTQIERIAEYAHVIMMQYGFKDKDIILISSNSGRNAMPVELAMACHELGMYTIAFTNLKHSQVVTSRHSRGLKLYQVCDYVIDNCGVVGDAMMEVKGVKGQMGASSSLIGMFMAQTLSMLIAQKLAEVGIEPPVFLSANVDEGDAWNQKIMSEYYHI